MELHLGGWRDLVNWAIVGSPQDCAETMVRCHEDHGLVCLGFGALNLPKGESARLEHLQLISEERLPVLP